MTNLLNHTSNARSRVGVDASLLNERILKTREKIWSADELRSASTPVLTDPPDSKMQSKGDAQARSSAYCALSCSLYRIGTKHRSDQFTASATIWTCRPGCSHRHSEMGTDIGMGSVVCRVVRNAVVEVGWIAQQGFRIRGCLAKSSRLCGVGRSGSSEGSTASDNYLFTDGGLSPPVLSGSILLKKDCDSEYRQTSSRKSPYGVPSAFLLQLSPGVRSDLTANLKIIL